MSHMKGLQLDDIFLEETVTLGRNDKKELLNSMSNVQNNDSCNNAYLPTHEGEFQSVEVHLMADDHVVDMTRGFDFSKPVDRSYSDHAMRKQPWLIVFKPQSTEDCDAKFHNRWIAELALKQHQRGNGFMIVMDEEDALVSMDTPQYQYLCQEDDVEFTPLEWCKYGLVSRPDGDHLSGIVCNVPEIKHVVEDCSKSLFKRKGRTLLLKD